MTRSALVRFVRCKAGLLLLVACAACGAEDTGPRAPGDTHVLRVLLDGVETTTIRAPALETAKRLSALLPDAAEDPSVWRVLEARAADGRFLRVLSPATTRAGQEARVYRDENGALNLGFFRPQVPSAPKHVQRALAKPTLRILKPVTVDVRTKEIPRPTRSADVALRVEVQGGASRTLSDADLAALPTSKSDSGGRGGGKGRRVSSGWLLRDVLAPVADPKAIARVLLHAEGREPVSVEGSVLRAGDKVARVKLNRRGQFVATVWDTAATPVAQLQQVRGLRRIVVVLDP